MSGPKIVDIRVVRAAQEREWRKLRHRIEQELEKLKEVVSAEVDQAGWSAIVALEHSVENLHEQYRECSLPTLLDSVLDQAEAQLKVALQLNSDFQQSRLERIVLEQAKRRSMRIAVEAVSERLKAAKQNDLSERLLREPSESNLQAAVDALAIDREQKAAAELQSIANEMGGPTKDTSLDQWLAKQSCTEDPLILRLERLAASVASLDGLHDVSDWLKQINTAAAVPDESRRRLLIDSIAIRLSDEQKRLQLRRANSLILDELEAELAVFGESAASLSELVTAARQSNIESISELTSQVRQWCDAESRRRDQAESREAILAVLRSLGYDVRESMATAWAEQGQVILQDSSRQDYGVELSTIAGERLKTQLVRFSNHTQITEKQKQRDIEVETLWCQSHAKVMDELQKRGLQTEVLASRPVGSTPVKVVEAKRVESMMTQDSRMQPLRQQKLP